MATFDRKKVGVLLGSMAIAALPTPNVEAVPETESNNTFPGQSATVGDLITGNLCPSCLSPPDTIDFFHYSGLPVGGTYDLTLTPGFTLLQAGQYTDQTTIASSVQATPAVPGHLVGTVPAGGELSFGITEVNVANFETYSITLNVTPPTTTIPEPATIALVAAGLSALGVSAARRRKRD